MDVTEVSLGQLARFFLRLGCTAFGGPAAHIAMLQDEVVKRRHWLSEEEFLDLLGAANLIPGPSSTELAIYLGYRLGGRAGLLLAGVCFILPATLIVLALAWTYQRYGGLPQVGGVLYGVKPVIVAVIVQAVWRMGRKAVKTRLLGVVAAAGLALALAGVPPLAILFGAGLLLGALAWARAEGGRSGWALLVMLALFALPAAAPLVLRHHSAGAVACSPAALFAFFLKVGSIVFGSGYVLLAFLQADLVTHWHWLTTAQLLDAVAVGQVTPGPVSTTATFIGFLLGGVQGAILATVAIFLPGFVLVALSGPLIPRLRASAVAAAYLDGVTTASLALMAAVTWQLGVVAVRDPLTAGLAALSAALLLRYGTNSMWLVLGGAVIGVLTGR